MSVTKRNKRAKPVFRTERNLALSPGPHNQAVTDVLLPQEQRNGYFNHFGIYLDYQTGRGKDIPMRENQGPCTVLGSGASLDHALPLLRDFKGAIFASSSHASSCVYHERPPDYVFLLDIRGSLDEMPIKGSWKQYSTQLILHPGVSSEWVSMPEVNAKTGEIKMVSAWPDRKLYYRPMEPSRRFYRETLPQAYPWIHSHVLLFACHTSDCVGVAKMMGYDPIILVGNDFLCTRFRDWKWKKKTRKGKPYGEEQWIRSETINQDSYKAQPVPDGGTEYNRLIQSDSGLITNDYSVYYKKTTMMVYRLDRANIIEATHGPSLLEEYPKISQEEAIERSKGGTEAFKDLVVSEEEKIRVSEDYLVHRRCFPIMVGEAIRFVEAAWYSPWEMCLRQYLEKFNKFADMFNKQPDIKTEEQRHPHIDVEKNVEYYKAIIDRIGIMGKVEDLPEIQRNQAQKDYLISKSLLERATDPEVTDLE